MTVRFVVVGLPRSGTNYFLSRLLPSPGVLIAWEPFNSAGRGFLESELLARQPEPERLDHFAVQVAKREARGLPPLGTNREDMAIRNALREQYFEDVFSSRSRLPLIDVAALGFKMFPSHGHDLFWKILRDPGLKVIVVDRRNRLASYSSHQIAMNTGLWTWKGERPQTMHFDAPSFAIWNQYANAVYASIRSHLLTFEIEHIHCSYEDFTVGDGPFEEACDLIGVPFAGEPSWLHRQNTPELLDRFSNRDEAYAYISSTCPEFLSDPGTQGGAATARHGEAGAAGAAPR